MFKLRRDDVVGLLSSDNKFKFGHVVSDDDEQVQVLWHEEDTITEEVFSKSVPEFQLSDRIFHPGDFVRRISDHKVGYVQNVEKFASVKLLHGRKENVIAVNVSARTLYTPKILTGGDYILFDKWVGKVVEVHRYIRLSTNGSEDDRYLKKTSVLPWSSLKKFSTVKDEFGRDKMFYVGMKLRDRKWRAIPESPVHDMSRQEFLNAVITKIWIEHATVKWIQNFHDKGSSDAAKPPPKECLKAPELTEIRRLSPFEELNVHLGSIRNLTLTNKIVVVPEKFWRRNANSPQEQFQEYNVVGDILDKRKSVAECVEVVNTRSEVQVVWLMDGTESTISSCKLADQLEGPSFFPGLHVSFQKVENGILRTVDLVNKMVTIESRKAGQENNVISASLYDVTEKSTTKFEVGNVVVVPLENKHQSVVLVLGYILCSRSDGTITVMSDDNKKIDIHSEHNVGYIDAPAKTSAGAQRTYEHLPSLKEMEWTTEERLSLDPEIKSSQKLHFHPSVPRYHSFYGKSLKRADLAAALKARVKSELDFILVGAGSLPVDVMAFRNRCDTYSVLLRGPPMTPYENVLFFFDLFLPANYPQVPPLLRYKPVKGQYMFHKFIRTDGIVDVPMLKTRFWKSTDNIAVILQFIYDVYLIERPALIPDFNFDDPTITSIDAVINEIRSATESSHCDIRAREGNEILLINILDACITMLRCPVSIWKNFILPHFKKFSFFQKLLDYVKMAPNEEELKLLSPIVPYPLFPLTKGGYQSVEARLNELTVLVRETCLPPPAVM